MARLFVIIGGLVVLVLTAALVAPYFIDWSSYRSAFEREVGRILGREVQVEGTARARLLPFPSVTFTDVVVVDPETGEPAMTVDEFSMDAELAPFLRGEVLIFDMRLVRPDMHVEIAPDGTVDWAVRPSARFNPRQVTLEKVAVSEGTITVHQQASGRTVTLDEIETELSARSLAGPWRVDGELEVDGMPTSLSAATGSVGDDGRMRLRVTLEPRDYPIALTTDGHARFEEEEGLYAGTFQLRTVEQDEDQDTGQSETPGNRVSGRFALNHQRLAIDEFLFETGPEDDPYTAEGQARVALGAEPSFSITADGAQIRIDPTDETGEGIAGVSADERLAALTEFMANLPKPTIPGTVALNLPAIVAGDTTIRNIRVEAEPVDTGWTIHSAAATLPGRTRFEGSGLLETGESLSFSGQMLLAISQPSGFAAWLARDVDDVIRRLPSAGFSADVELTQERQTFDNLELVLGDARFGGVIDRRSPPNARPSLAMNMNGDQLDVEGMQAFASLFVDDSGRNRLASHDVDLEIDAGPVSARGLTAERLETALRLREGSLEIDQLTITGLAGARISATGQVRDFESTPTGRVDATVIAVDLAPLTELLAQRFPEVDLFTVLARNARNFPGLFSDGEINVVASAADDGDGSISLAASADGRAGGTEFSASISSGGTLAQLGSAQTTVNFSGRNNNAAALYALFGLPALPLDLAGSAEVEISANGVPNEGMETTFSFGGDGLSAGFEGQVAFTREGPVADGTARLESEDLEPWLAVSGVSFPGFGFGLPVELAADVEYSDALAVVNDISGHVAESSVSGDLNGELRDGIPHLTGELALGVLDLGIGAEMIAGSEAFQPDEGTWPQTPFRQRTGIPFSADVRLLADNLWFGNTIGAEDAQMRLALEPGELSISELTTKVFDGSAEGLAEFRNNEGTGLLSAQFSLTDADLQNILPEASLTGRADLSASVTASGRSVNAIASSLSGSGSVTLSDLRIMGLEDNALPPILEQADPLGIDIDAGDVASIAPPLVRNGDFRANDVEFAFSLANGVARTPPVQLESEHATMSVEAAADFGAWMLSADGSVAYDPADEGLAGSEPTVRFSVSGPPEEPRLELDTEPLAQFLTQRALEREQRRVEHMQAVLLEKQRLRREQRYFESLVAERRAIAAELIRLERQAELMRRARAERERRRAEQASAESEQGAAPDAQGGDVPDAASEQPPLSERTIERRPLPLPPAQERENTSRNQSPSGRSDVNVENLTVDGLLDLLDNPQ